jgi:hypothetical protein
MQRRLLLLVTVAPALLLGACAHDAISPTGPAAAEATLSRAGAPASVPLRGSVAATETGTFDPVAGRVRIVLVGSGTASHLGRYTLVSRLLLDPVPEPAPATGTMTLTAADGSTLVASFTGLGARQPNSSIVLITETATITGGTGRFADAAGQFTLERRLDQATGVSSGRFEGSLELRP